MWNNTKNNKITHRITDRQNHRQTTIEQIKCYIEQQRE